MERTTIEAGSGKSYIQIPSEWLRRSLLEGGEKLQVLIEVVRKIERFDFEYVVYPGLVAAREAREAQALADAFPKEAHAPPRVVHTHIFATIKKKLRERGVLPYCISCGKQQTP